MLGDTLGGFNMCYNPLYVKVKDIYDVETGEFKKKMVFFKNDCCDYDYTLPCGKCAECLLQKSTEWSYRIMLESQQYKRSCFITLTYAKNPVSLNKRDYQLFFKRLRKKIGPFRYFLCGEYGSQGKRPHFHAIIFGYWPEDAEPVLNSNYFGSKFIEETWGLGFISVGELSLYDAKYCAKYMQKLQSMPANFVQPFVSMSLKPGLGYQYFLDHKESLLKTDKIYFHGKYIKTPRYFLNKSLVEEPEKYLNDFLDLKAKRQLKADLVPNTQQNLDARKLKYKKLLT